MQENLNNLGRMRSSVFRVRIILVWPSLQIFQLKIYFDKKSNFGPFQVSICHSRKT